MAPFTETVFLDRKHVESSIVADTLNSPLRSLATVTASLQNASPLLSVQASIELRKPVVPTDVLKLLLDPLYRLQWDSTVSEMDTIAILGENEVVQRTVQTLLLKRERIELVTVKQSANCLRVVARSVPSATASAETKLVWLEVISRGTSTYIEMTSQVNWNLPAELDIQQQFIAHKRWLKTFAACLQDAATGAFD